MMKNTILFLKALFTSSVVISLIIILLFECEILLSGQLAGNMSAEFYGLMASELATICVVPLALWMFRAKRIKRALVDGKEVSLRKYGTIRILMLSVPMMLNTLLYYLFMLPSFGYLAIILFLSMFFVLPTSERCLQDVSE